MVRDSTILYATFGLMFAFFTTLWRDELRNYPEIPVFLLGVTTLAFLLGAMTERASERKEETPDR